MQLPRGDEYNQAIQNPKHCFDDNELKNCRVELNKIGLPKPYSGGFTTTYQLINGSGKYAVRCFTRDIKDLEKRYKEINNFFVGNKSQYFVNAGYVAQGIKINSKYYPIIKMKWLEGEPLNIFLDKNYRNTQIIKNVIVEFQKLVTELEKLGIAHGDIQHGNIIVNGGKLYLIDYDGMYFPNLSGLVSNEVGHPNFQHPQRTSKHYNNKIDRFASLVIYTALKAIMLKPQVWA